MLLFVMPILFVAVNAQTTYDRLDIYLQPSIMEVDGSIRVAVRIRNIERVPLGISGVGFNLNVDTAAFTVASSPFSISDETLITNAGDFLSNVSGGDVSFMFIDMSLGDRLITRDGILVYLNIRARAPQQFFHGAEVYPIMFHEDSIQVTMLDTVTQQIVNFYNFHVWDVNVGGQVFDTVLPQLRVPIADEVGWEFRDFGYQQSILWADYREIYTDVVPFVDSGELMIPIRFLADAVSAGVQWRVVPQTVHLATVDNDIAVITVGSNVLSVNGEEVQMIRSAMIRDNRVFIPEVDAVRIFPTLVITR